MQHSVNILVVALHQHRPGRDRADLQAFHRGVARYRDEQARLSGPQMKAPITGRDTLKLYNPVSFHLWGPFDRATFYLADDLESLMRQTSRGWASAEEHFFGPVLTSGEGPEARGRLDALEALMAPDADRPLVVLVLLKTADHLMAAGSGPLRRALSRAIRDRVPEGVACTILRSYAWHDLGVALVGSDPCELLTLARAIEELQADDLDVGADPELAALLTAPRARRLLQTNGESLLPDEPVAVATQTRLGLYEPALSSSSPQARHALERACLEALSAIPPQPRLQASPRTLSRAIERHMALPGWDRRAMNRHSIGQVERQALGQLVAAVRRTMTRPDMFSAMLPLDNALRALRSEFLNHDQTPGDLTFVVREVTREVQRAYLQRLCQSPMMSGAPSVGLEIPYGLGQLVVMLGGVAEAIMNLGHAADDAQSGLETVVVLGADASVAMRCLRRVGIFHLSYLQAFVPMSLGVLFHELGHWLLRRVFSARYVAWKRANDTLVDLLIEQDNMAVPGLETRSEAHRRALLEPFLEEVYAHAAWRMLGCGNDLARFERAYLSAMAMGLRLDTDLRNPNTAMEVWGTALVHLYIQRVLHANNDDVTAALSAIHEALVWSQGVPWEGLVQACAPWFEPELDRILMAPKSRHALLQIMLRLWFEPLCLIAEPSRETRHVRHLLRLLVLQVKDLSSRVEAEHEAFEQSSPAYRGLGAAIRGGRAASSAPWGLLSEDGRAGVRAFLWTRRIAMAATESFVAAERSGPIALPRGLDGEVQPHEGALEGGYADHFGGILVVGREARSAHLAVTTAAIESLWEVSARVLAGRLERFVAHRRRWERVEIDREAHAIFLDAEGVFGAWPELSGVEVPPRWRLEIPAEALAPMTLGCGRVRAVDICPSGVGLSLPVSPGAGAMLLSTRTGRSVLGEVRWRHGDRLGVRLVAEVAWTRGKAPTLLEASAGSIERPWADWLWGCA